MRYAAGLAVVVALAGCGGTSGGGGGPSSTRSVRSTASPTPSSVQSTSGAIDPVLARIPAAARPETMKGAEAYVKFYFEEVNRAFIAADASRLKGLSGASCEMCSAMAQGVIDLAAKGRHYERPLALVNFATALEFTPSSRRVLVDAGQSHVNVLDRRGNVVDETDAATLRLVATVSFDGHWMITRLQRPKS